MILDFMTDLTNLMNQFKEFVYINRSNPLMWLGFFLLGLAIFELVYYSLQKEK
jgi:hypothetical protein